MARLPERLLSLVSFLCACGYPALCQTKASMTGQSRQVESTPPPHRSPDGGWRYWPTTSPPTLPKITGVLLKGLGKGSTGKPATLIPQYSTPGLGAIDACDLNADGTVNSADVQMAVNQALNLEACTDADLHLNNTCTVLDVQVIAADIVTGTCLVPNCPSPLTYPSTLPNPTVAPACPPPLPVNPNPPNSTLEDDGPIHPCMYVEDGVRFQAIEVTGVSGEQALNLNLYEGAACNPNNLVDQVFFGEPYPFYPNATMLYWMRHFWDQPGTSAVWTVGNITTPCIDYSKVPDCD